MKPPKREPITADLKVQSLLFRATVICPLCGADLMPGQEIEWDHQVPVALGGSHDFANIRPVHKRCHARKSFGSKATTAGSDIHKIAKAKRIAAGGKKVKRPMPKGQKREWSARPFRRVG